MRDAIAYEMGTFGGFTFGQGVSVIHKGDGLRVYAGRGICNVDAPPLFSGKAAVQVFRELYGVFDPAKRQQLDLFGGVA